ncbi:MAG TPA: hypothetical protein VEW28_06085 [Candidatus Kapabacteria bacterium]|nr:hypothetical protein [Candidatus Kapabacteria bacterium]
MTKLLSIFALAFASACSLGSCSNSTSSTPGTSAEHIAQDSDFANFAAWTQTVPHRMGFDPSGLLSSGMAHGVNDPTISRYIYLKQASATVDASGNFPVGTVFYKNLKMNGMNVMGTGMVKRGGSYNSTGRSCEYFLLSADGKITSRGDTLMGGMCQSCHNSAPSGHDYIFTK